MPAWVVPAIMGAASLVSGWISNNKQRKANQKMQREQIAGNEQYLAEQNEYNSPQSQMQRFKEAGLNPNLIYGQGNPGNQSAPMETPQYEQRYENITPQALQMMNQTGLMQSQIQAQNANTRRTGVLTQLNALQAEVLKNNPLLHGALEPIITSMKAAAESKVANAGMDTLKSEWYSGKAEVLKPGQHRLEAELDLLNQRYNLGEQDADIKAQIIQSQQFQNDLLEVQKKWMTDGQITPQHIYQFIQLFLMKMLTFKSK